MYERLLAVERKSFAEAHLTVLKEKAFTIRDLNRVENGYQLFRKKYPQAAENSFREFIREVTPGDYEKAKKIFKWK